ncbi:MAG: UDP-N-acetylmuramoyl-L-alanyl-D-glutamate--2,6-diaminopimelate ligase [Pseudolabrys sp.]|nr:UDP-N-acetylmuramoyl-L-alanyl-D-glutamate--2,6-diaminopimelate ligase [Pseudolabrys sp.]
MRLRDLLARSDFAAGDIEITGVSADSRKVRPGFLFVAIPGTKTDGARFIEQAIKAGAVAVLAEGAAPPAPSGIAAVSSMNARRDLALAAARLNARQPATIAAVTGTSGKTSVAAFTRQIWAAQGYAAASIGTVGVVSPKGEVYGSLTTPDPVDLHRAIDALAGEGVTHLALEASSHGLDQHRLDGVRIKAGGFTNLSRDHLDYHATLEAYLAAKLRLFTDLVAADGAAVIAADHEQSAAVAQAARQRGLRVFTVGRAGEAIRLRDVAIDGFTQRLSLDADGRTIKVKLPLVGAFQIENALVAAGLAIVTGSDSDQVFAALSHLEGAKGRLEFAGRYRDAPVFIDYAHKPDALAKALDALRPYARGRLVVVFGAGGDRDAGKRPIMGAIATEKADRIIVTDDNPRSENAAAIRAAIMAAAPGAREIGDRGEAIHRAIADLQAGDVLLIAGKGHETGQIIGDRTIHFSDHEAVAAALADLGSKDKE